MKVSERRAIMEKKIRRTIRNDRRTIISRWDEYTKTTPTYLAIREISKDIWMTEKDPTTNFFEQSYIDRYGIESFLEEIVMIVIKCFFEEQLLTEREKRDLL